MFLIRHTEGVSCYTCTYTYTGTDRDKECVDTPWNVTQGGKLTMCPDSRFCTTYRQYDYAMNAVRSFARLCSERMGNKCQEDTVFRRQDCYTTCQEELCNDSDGVPAGYKKLPADSGGLGVGVDSGTSDGDGGGDNKHARGPSGSGSRDMGVGGDGGNNGNNGNNGNSNDKHINNNNGNNGNGGNNGNNNNDNNNIHTANNNNGNNNNGNNTNGHNGGSDSSDNISGAPGNSSDSANTTARPKRPLPLPAWKDEWNFKEGASRSSRGGAGSVSFSPLACSVLLVSLLL